MPISPSRRRFFQSLRGAAIGASALGQPAGGVEEVSNKDVKLKTELKYNKQTKNWSWKLTKVDGKNVKVKVYPKIEHTADHKGNITR